MRRFAYRSIFDALLYFLNLPTNAEKPADARRLPWVAENLIVYLLRDEPRQYGNGIADQNTVRDMIGLCWQRMDSLVAGKMEIENLTLFMRSAMLPQAPHQFGLNPTAFTRQIAIAQKLEKNSILYLAMCQAARMPLEDFFDLAMMAWRQTTEDRPWFSTEYIVNLGNIVGHEKASRFFGVISHSMPILQTAYRKTVRDISVDELFQPTLLYRTPCIQLEAVTVPIGRPALRRFFETFIADQVEQHSDIRVRQSWEKNIEKYALEVTQGLSMEVLGDTAIRQRFGIARDQKCCDVALITEDTIICVEVKSKSLSAKLPAAASSRDMIRSLKATVISADQQLLSVARAIRSSPDRALTIYSLIVTSTDLYLGSADDLLSSEWADDQLLRPIIMSLDDYDRLVEGHRLSKFDVVDVLSEYVARVSAKPHSLRSLSHMLSEDRYSIATPEHLQQVFMNRVRAVEKLAMRD